MTKNRAPGNRTITLADADRHRLRARLADPAGYAVECDRTLCADSFGLATRLPAASVDLLILDPPYNLNKKFGNATFARRSVEAYTDWLGATLDAFLHALKPAATVYIFGDWHTSASIFPAAAPRLHIRNRITWEREKGRGARMNWKNASEDIWFCTVGEDYTFNVDAVKLRRKVMAPYRSGDGRPKDWHETNEGNFRDTFPSNFWSDITIPFWSMPGNTDHPTRKSEKLIAKLVLASSGPGDVVLDPFPGSGTTSVVARRRAALSYARCTQASRGIPMASSGSAIPCSA